MIRTRLLISLLKYGFALYQGPEIDDDQRVFTMLNFAADHLRDMQDTSSWAWQLHYENVLLMITSNEAHYIYTNSIVCFARVVYRIEAYLRHYAFFHQVEGLYVDRC